MQTVLGSNRTFLIFFCLAGMKAFVQMFLEEGLFWTLTWNRKFISSERESRTYVRREGGFWFQLLSFLVWTFSKVWLDYLYPAGCGFWLYRQRTFRVRVYVLEERNIITEKKLCKYESHPTCKHSLFLLSYHWWTFIFMHVMFGDLFHSNQEKVSVLDSGIILQIYIYILPRTRVKGLTFSEVMQYFILTEFCMSVFCIWLYTCRNSSERKTGRAERSLNSVWRQDAWGLFKFRSLLR